MIVSCPSCGTRYKHQSAEGTTAAAGRCSHCDDMVPLVVAGRPYLILPPGEKSRAGMQIGMDDPRLAEQLSRTALDGSVEQGSSAISYRIADGTQGGTPMKGNRAARFSGANGSAPAIFDKRRLGLLPSMRRKKQSRTDLKRGGAEVEQPRNRALEVTVTGVLMVVGAATAYFSAVEHGLQPLTWIVAGGGLGLFMAWICLRWTRQH
jgi:hypothetical protein